MKISSVLLVPHTGRLSSLTAAAEAASLLRSAGITVRVLRGAMARNAALPSALSQLPSVSHSARAGDGVDLVVVLGGDGTFLRAADIAHAGDLPVLGINLGQVGFLAEGEGESLTEALSQLIAGNVTIEERMTLDIAVRDPQGRISASGFALNEVSVENSTHRGVLDAIVEVDNRPVASYGCDGVIVSTPTGSTAYAFSAGGPILWPELDAILVVPNNAHALFAKPLVVAPKSTVAIETVPTAPPASAVLDGFRSMSVPPGSRVEVSRGARPVKWVRLDSAPFADRLVKKFRLPVTGWRGRKDPTDTVIENKES